jgi:hypothetical protein
MLLSEYSSDLCATLVDSCSLERLSTWDELSICTPSSPSLSASEPSSSSLLPFDIFTEVLESLHCNSSMGDVSLRETSSSAPSSAMCGPPSDVGVSTLFGSTPCSVSQRSLRISLHSPFEEFPHDSQGARTPGSFAEEYLSQGRLVFDATETLCPNWSDELAMRLRRAHLVRISLAAAAPLIAHWCFRCGVNALCEYLTACDSHRLFQILHRTTRRQALGDRPVDVLEWLHWCVTVLLLWRSQQD